MFRNISRSVWILSLISLFTDMASEMLYPIMPIYLQSIGFSILLIGVLEGLAEATAGLSKGYFGALSDHYGKRVPFVRLGYTLSALSKPMMGLWSNVFWIFTARTTDRLGKGIRTGARDALLSEASTPENKGSVFGLHRSMDTLGAFAGPALALVFLYFFPEQYTVLFFIAFIPGVLAVGLSYLLKEKEQLNTARPSTPSPAGFWRYWKISPKGYKQLTAGLFVFALFNSSDVFLLLKAKASGLNDSTVIGVYIFYNLIYAIFAFPLGALSDHIGMKPMLVTGLLLFALTYAGMSYSGNGYGILTCFFLYGLYAAATEGISKAWITQIVPPQDTATAIGTYAGIQSICALLASSVAGWLWYSYGANYVFMLSGIAAGIVCLYLLVAVNQPDLPAKT